MSRIYESDLPTPFLPTQSAFDYLFPSGPGISPQEQRDPRLPAFIDGRDGLTLTRGELREGSLALAGGLRKLGVQRGDVACIWGFNSIEYVQAVYGCLAAGVTISPANYAYSPTELGHQINDSEASVIFIDPALVPQFEEARKHIKANFPNSRVILLARKGQGLPGLKTLSESFGTPLPEAENFDGVASQSTAWLCYSSGTTGLPKGVMTTHYNITSQLQASNLRFEDMQSGKDVILGFVPFSHIYGVTLSLLQPITRGVPVVVLPKFDELQVLSAIQKFKVTVILLVPPLFIVLVNSKNLKNYDLSTVRLAMSGAAPLSAELSEAFAKVVPTCTIIQGYGMTETTPNICTMNAADAAGRQGWVGRLIPTYQARMVGEDGKDVDASKGESGELWVRGPSVMKGYHKNEAATIGTMARGGWLKTGDIVIKDDEGWFKVVDRLKELIKYKGFQVAPAELEALLITHPKILDAGVVGVYDESEATEFPRAYIVTHDKLADADHAAFAREVDAWVAARVARHKRLGGGIIVIEAIPKSPSGKILRKDLRKRAQAEWDARTEKGRARL